MKKEPMSVTTKIWISFFILFGLFVIGSIFVLILTVGSSEEKYGANTALIKIIGPISGDSDGSVLSAAGASSTDIVKELEKARDDDNIKAVILEINSPGGSAVASDEIAQAVKDVRQHNKTVVAWVREEGASGAYWIATSSDHIVANRMSITGSIGVISSYLQFDRFIADWNVSYNRLVAGNNKDIGDPFVNLSDDKRAFLQSKLNRVHGFFIEEVAKNRNMSRAQVAKLADGSFFLGIEAKDAGLVDELGGKQEAINYIEKKNGITVEIVEYEVDEGFLSGLLGTFSNAKKPSLSSLVEQQTQQTLRDDAPVPMLR